jgi:hypothetical protein
MAESLAAAFAAKYTSGIPNWVDPFLRAVRRMEIVEKRERTGKTVTKESLARAEELRKRSYSWTNAGKEKKVEKDGDVALPDDDGVGDEVEDELMLDKAEEYLKSVSIFIIVLFS